MSADAGERTRQDAAGIGDGFAVLGFFVCFAS